MGLSKELLQLLPKPPERVELYQRALNHKSFANENPGEDHNETLEFLGDAVIGSTIAEFLFQECPDRDEGYLSKWKAHLVSGEVLAKAARSMSLGNYLRLGAGLARDGLVGKDRVLSSAFEALTAAVFLDAGYAAARSFVLTHLEEETRKAKEGSTPIGDPKSQLLEYLAANNRPAPKFQTIDERKGFTTILYLLDKRIGKGTGRTRKASQMAAAKQGLATLKKEKDELQKKKRSVDPSRLYRPE